MGHYGKYWVYQKQGNAMVKMQEFDSAAYHKNLKMKAGHSATEHAGVSVITETVITEVIPAEVVTIVETEVITPGNGEVVVTEETITTEVVLP